MKTTKLITATVCSAVALASWSSNAAEEEKEKKGWETTAAAGLTLTRGNSETFLGTVTLDTKRKWEKDEALFGAAFGYGDSVDPDTDVKSKNTHYLRGFGQYNHLFSERLYGGVRLDAEYDAIAGVEYRVRISPLLGYYLVKNDKTSLAAEAGPSVVFEDLKGSSSDTYVAVRIGERFEHKLTETTKIWQSAEYLPDVEDWTGKFLVNFEAGIDAAITKKLSLRTVLQDNYNSQPSSGRKENDIRLIAGLAYKF